MENSINVGNVITTVSDFFVCDSCVGVGRNFMGIRIEVLAATDTSDSAAIYTEVEMEGLANSTVIIMNDRLRSPAMFKHLLEKVNASYTASYPTKR